MYFMKVLKISLLTLMALLCGLQSYAQQKLKLAVLDPVIAGEKLTDGLAISVREIVSSSFVNYGENYAIVERSLIDKVLQEANFSNSDAVDESQATQLGKLAGADKVVLTVISRFDNRCMMSIKMIDVESATIDKQISKLVEISSLLDVTEPLTLAILGKADANAISSASASSSTSNSSSQQMSPPIQRDQQKKGGIKSWFSKKSDAENSASVVSVETGPIQFPEFNGTGVNYTNNIVQCDPQPEEFNIYNFGPLFNNNALNVIVDLSDTMVSGMTLPQFLELKRRDPKKTNEFGFNFFANMNSEVDRFIKALNDEAKLNVSYYPGAAVTLVVKVRTIDDPGRENLSDYLFIDTNTGQIICGIRLKSKGGRFGSWTNLFGDALEEDAAPALGGKIKSARKKYKKMN